jgi:hypothetical protein
MYSKEKRKFYNKKWRENNKEKISNYQKIWRSEHKDALSAKNKLYREKNKQKLQVYRRIQNRKLHKRYALGKHSAKRRNIIFLITYEEWYIEILKPCYYCNNVLKNPNENAGFAIDRIDSTKGYINNNIVSCCGFCNLVKGYLLTQEETKAAIEAIIFIRQKNANLINT